MVCFPPYLFVSVHFSHVIICLFVYTFTCHDLFVCVHVSHVMISLFEPGSVRRRFPFAEVALTG